MKTWSIHPGAVETIDTSRNTSYELGKKFQNGETGGYYLVE